MLSVKLESFVGILITNRHLERKGSCQQTWKPQFGIKAQTAAINCVVLLFAAVKKRHLHLISPEPKRL